MVYNFDFQLEYRGSIGVVCIYANTEMTPEVYATWSGQQTLRLLAKYFATYHHGLRLLLLMIRISVEILADEWILVVCLCRERGISVLIPPVVGTSLEISRYLDISLLIRGSTGALPRARLHIS